MTPKLAFLLLLLLNSLFLSGQTSDYHFKHLSTANGLSNNSIIAIEQDALGQIWFGTRNGLNKYDGNDFVVFRNNPKDPKSISNADILSILEDKKGNIWVGTYNGLNRYDPKSNRFKRFYQGDIDKNRLVNAVVICSQEMPNDDIWFGTGNGISIYSYKTRRFVSTFYGNNKRGNLNHINVQRIFLDTKNEVWVGSNKGLSKLESRKKNKFVFKNFEWTDKEITLFVQDILEIEDGILAIATKNKGLLFFDTVKEKFIDTPYSKDFDNTDVRVLKMDDEANLWIGTTNGVFIIKPTMEVTHLQENRSEYSGISQNFIKSIFKDNSGSMWLGTYSGGANIWNKSNENFIHIKNNDVFNNVVNAVVKDEKSNIYFATEGGVINLLKKDGSVSNILKVPNNKGKLSYPIQTMLYTKPDLLWVGVLNHGVFVYDLKTKKERTDIVSKELKNYLKNTGVFSIKKGNYGNFWIGTFGKGVIRYNINTKAIKVINRPHISTNIIKNIHLDEDGSIWLGGLGAINVLRLNEVGEYDVFRYFDGTKALRYNIKTIYKDTHGSMWVGTNTRGLYEFNGKDFQKVVIDAKNPVSTINTIIEDDDGVLWISSDRGIVRYNPLDKKSMVYDQRRIASNDEFSPNSGLRLKNNQFYFGGFQGITTFNPNDIVKNEYTPRVILSDFKLKNESVKIRGDLGILSKSISYTRAINLSHDNSSFSIRYTLPNYVNSKGNSFAYRLKGLDDSWTYTKYAEAFFTLQDAGTYFFQVKGINNDGVWSNKITTLKIIVKPAPWKTTGAYIAYFILACGALFIIYWMLQSKARLRHKLELEYLENKRNEELNNAKLQFFTNISHEFRTPLTLILGPLQQILNDYTGTNAIYKKLKIIKGSANHLLRLINRLMDFRKLENDQFELEAAKGNIVKFLKEIFLSFSEYAKLGGYDYTFNVSEDVIYVYYDRYKFERVFYNLLSNAFRYTNKGGRIAVYIEKNEESEVVVKIEDSGVGIAEEHIDKIFDRFFEIPIHNNPDKNYNKGTGIGLSIASNIVKLHHGTISVENVNPNGARFIVKLKLGNSHLTEKEISKNFKLSDDVSQYAAQIGVPEIELNSDIGDLVLEEKEYTVLIVEDNTILRSFMKELLKETYNVLQAENGKVALEIAIKELPDLIISDVIMPQMVGTELCSLIKTNIKTSHIPVILLTSRTSLVYKFEGLESGADDYISKPFNLKEFKLKVKNLLDSQQRIKEKFSADDSYTVFNASLTSLDEELLKKAFKIVENNLSNEDFDIDLFSTELGLSRSMLFVKIKAWTNFTPKDFIQEIRLKSAAKLLELDKISISEVGYKVGFKRPKYFSQCFKKKYGVSPSEFVKKFKTNK